VLVATTVIEVGVDVPNATLMIVEGAERFGLAQLHQLRGASGGERRQPLHPAARPDLERDGRARLALMRETNDGFRIAEEDLAPARPGEILGTRQSGEQNFRWPARGRRRAGADRQGDARSARPRRRPRSDAARQRALCLYLFERDAAVGLLRSG
jgi:ATP-dependent DNA helicase RecG